MTIEEYFDDWCSVIDTREADRILRKLSASHSFICPQIKDIFKAFRLCPFHELRCVLIGQDPYADWYEGAPRATGIAFANNPNTPLSSFSPSLEILRESVIDFTVPHKNINFDPSLEKWAKQGVLLLNSALSCEKGKSNSHALLWRPFIRTLLTNLSQQTFGIVYVLMGKYADSFEPCISKTNYILHCRHPAYYARNHSRMPSDIWREINTLLVKLNGYGIEWYNEY